MYAMTARTLFVSDLDGTLLGPVAALSEFSRTALRSLLADGVLFTVATARSMPSIRWLLGDVGLALPVIELNGAFVSDLATGRHLVVQGLAAEVAAAVMARIRRRGLEAFIATAAGDEDRLYHGEPRNPGMAWYRDEKRAMGDPRLRAVADVEVALAEPVVGFTLFAEQEVARELADELRAEIGEQVQLHRFENFYCPGWWELSIHDRSATKASAIAKLRRSLGLVASRLVVFGDGLNDLDMFADADHAVAVENAVPELRAVASEVAGRNDEDGVVRWLAAAIAAGRV
jgi:Cof subfamily protein (haloacid dehalogenase superfamily)